MLVIDLSAWVLAFTFVWAGGAKLKDRAYAASAIGRVVSPLLVPAWAVGVLSLAELGLGLSIAVSAILGFSYSATALAAMILSAMFVVSV